MNKFLTELIASTFFLYIILATNNNAVAVGAALAIAIMLGGGNVNPAATIMNVMRGTVAMNDAIPTILIQVAGGLIALELHKRIRL